jgi:hypothetical protein
MPDALFRNRAVFQDNGDRQVVRPTAFIAKGKDTVLRSSRYFLFYAEFELHGGSFCPLLAIPSTKNCG